MNTRALPFAEQVVNLTKKDVMFAISFKPYSHQTVQAVQYAKERKIKVISVSDKLTSALMPYSDVFLQVAVDSMTIANSIMPALVLIYAITSQIGLDQKHKTLESIESIEHIRKQRKKTRKRDA